MLCKRIASRCLSHMLSSDKVCNLVGANANIMSLLIKTTQNVLELPRFTSMEALDYCCNFLNQRCIECVGTAWIDLDKHGAKTKHEEEREKIFLKLESSKQCNFLRLVQVYTVGHLNFACTH